MHACGRRSGEGVVVLDQLLARPAYVGKALRAERERKTVYA
jgi:hypothetical protein